MRILSVKGKAEALGVLANAHDAGFRDANWARRDPDVALLHSNHEFERLYPLSKQLIVLGVAQGALRVISDDQNTAQI